jgi:hypothetical protein
VVLAAAYYLSWRSSFCEQEALPGLFWLGTTGKRSSDSVTEISFNEVFIKLLHSSRLHTAFELLTRTSDWSAE